jgi:hypothetical protein
MRTAKYAVAFSVAAIGSAFVCAALAFGTQAGSYSGKTSQPGSSVSFTVPSGGNSVDDFKAEMSATCTKGTMSQSVDVALSPTPSMKVRDGEFGFGGGFVFRNGQEPIGHGKGKVNGTFSSDHQVTGTFRFPWDFFANAGLLSGYHCDTGKVSFQASVQLQGQEGAKCIVPKLRGKKLKAAKLAVRRAHCRVGRIVKRHSGKKRLRVIKQRPRPRTERAAGSPVKLVVSRGPAR